MSKRLFNESAFEQALACYFNPFEEAGRKLEAALMDGGPVEACEKAYREQKSRLEQFLTEVEDEARKSKVAGIPMATLPGTVSHCRGRIAKLDKKFAAIKEQRGISQVTLQLASA